MKIILTDYSTLNGSLIDTYSTVMLPNIKTNYKPVKTMFQSFKRLLIGKMM